MSDETARGIIGALIGSLLALLVTLTIWERSELGMKAKAVERGAADWVVDQKTGKTTFTWKEVGK